MRVPAHPTVRAIVKRESLLTNRAIDATDLGQILLTDSPEEAVTFIQKSVLGGYGLRYVRRKPRRFFFERGI